MEKRRFIDEQIANPGLCADLVAESIGISLRYLFYLFQHDNITFSQYVRNQRLEKCREDLLNDSSNRQTITEIAFKWGFNNFSHFSRLFKQVYNTSPKQYRQSSG